MNYVIVDIVLSPTELMKFYKGQAKMISTLARDGRRVEIPAEIIRRFIKPEGIKGSFIVYFDQHHHLIQIDQLA